MVISVVVCVFRFRCFGYGFACLCRLFMCLLLRLLIWCLLVGCLFTCVIFVGCYGLVGEFACYSLLTLLFLVALFGC